MTGRNPALGVLRREDALARAEYWRHYPESAPTFAEDPALPATTLVGQAVLEGALDHLAAWQFTRDRHHVVHETPDLAAGLLAAAACRATFHALARHGVSRAAAHTPANGVDVLAQRIGRRLRTVALEAAEREVALHDGLRRQTDTLVRAEGVFATALAERDALLRQWLEGGSCAHGDGDLACLRCRTRALLGEPADESASSAPCRPATSEPGPADEPWPLLADAAPATTSEDDLPATDEPAAVARPVLSRLSFATLRAANEARLPTMKNGRGAAAHAAPDGSDWSPAQWLQALVGEVGEYANVRKRYERGDLDWLQFRDQAGRELADIMAYLDLLAGQLGFDLGALTVAKFNEVSARVGSPVRLAEDGSALLPCEPGDGA